MLARRRPKVTGGNAPRRAVAVPQSDVRGSDVSSGGRGVAYDDREETGHVSAGNAAKHCESEHRGMYRIVVPGRAPTSNERVTAAVKGHAAWQRAFGLAALAQLRAQGLTSPLTGPVLCQVVEAVGPRGRRDAGTGCKAILDALNGVAYRDDRQLACHPPATVDHSEGPIEVRVWLGLAEAPGVWREWVLLTDEHVRARLAEMRA